MSRSFIVADLDGKRRHFSNLDNAVKFAITQAKSAWNMNGWSIKVKDTDIRINVNEQHDLTIRNNGQLVGTGVFHHFASMDVAAWDLVSVYNNA